MCPLTMSNEEKVEQLQKVMEFFPRLTQQMDNDDDVNWNETRQVSPAIESIESLTEISSIVSEPPEIRQMTPVKPIRQDLNATIDGMAHLASTKEPKPVKRGGFLRKSARYVRRVFTKKSHSEDIQLFDSWKLRI